MYREKARLKITRMALQFCYLLEPETWFLILSARRQVYSACNWNSLMWRHRIIKRVASFPHWKENPATVDLGNTANRKPDNRDGPTGGNYLVISPPFIALIALRKYLITHLRNSPAGPTRVGGITN